MKTHNVINLFWDTVSFSGTEAECWNYIHTKYGNSLAATMLDVQPI